MKQVMKKDINKINTVEDKDLEYQKEIVNYLKEYDRFLHKIALSVKSKCRRLEIEDIIQQITLVILTNSNKFDKKIVGGGSVSYSQSKAKNILNLKLKFQ